MPGCTGATSVIVHNHARWIITAGFLLVLAYAAWYVTGKERILREGELILLDLVPVDPRSLLQGDYMQLRYAIGADIERDSLEGRGYLVYRRGPDSVATFVRLQATVKPLGDHEGVLLFRRRRAGAIRPNSMRVGPESYFFQEGRAGVFAGARYGGLRVDERGEVVLVGLYDGNRRLIR